MEQEKRYLSVLPHLTRYDIHGDSLYMHTDDDMFLLFQAGYVALRKIDLPFAGEPLPTVSRNLPHMEGGPATLSDTFKYRPLHTDPAWPVRPDRPVT